MTFNIWRADLAKLNSMTKYPSILTYHCLGDKGILQEEVQIPFTGRVIGTEKVDGTNTRLIFCPDGSVLVGSREDLLWERHDLIGNPAMGIVEAVKETVHRLAATVCKEGLLTVFFVEVYGKNIGGGAKNYSKQGKVGFRLFDAIQMDNLEEQLEWPLDRIAQWRDAGGQKFVEASRIGAMATEVGFEPVPALFDFDAAKLPLTLEDTHRFLHSFEVSQCKLDEGAEGIPEGVVVRTNDRSAIAKIRREDYERTLKRRKK
jgi:hypothetical protein